jgi:2-methylcitrate dehydratase PrpD
LAEQPISPTRALAAFVADAPAGVASPRAQAVLKEALLDLLGCIVAGAAEEAGVLARDYAVAQAAGGPATVFGTGRRLSPALAALVNGTAGHALDFDDIGLGVGHVSVAIVPAALAVAEQTGADGAALLDALVLGYEVAHRLTTMYPDTRLGPYAAGYHKPGVYAAFGGTAAAGRLLGLDADRLAHAFGIAATQAGGLRANFGTMTKPLHAGLANRTAVEAALLAGAGFTASQEILEQRFGWHDVICRGEGELGVVLDGLGEASLNGRWAVTEGLVFKAYPCCGANHYAIDAVLHVLRQHGLGLSDVSTVDVDIEERNLRDVLVYDWPRSGLEGKFSLAYNIAAALTDNAVTTATFTDDSLARLGVARDRIRIHPVGDLPQNGARVAVRTRDGRTFTREQLILRGSLADPMSWEELAAKFGANVRGTGRFAAGAVEQVVAALATLEKQPDLRAVTEPLLG